MDKKKEIKQEVVEETKPETNFKTVAEIYTEALKGMAVVVYHLHRSTGQNMRSIVRNVVASDKFLTSRDLAPGLVWCEDRAIEGCAQNFVLNYKYGEN